ncbi:MULTISPECIES: glycosyltransferase [Enterobacter]|uniref:glycosyltransferase n=1 Tax=Enterobacter TaxID=547 RepID=UPI0009EF543A|nr:MULTISPECIES: glycosyltransferase [Enterobacter]MBS0865797.1 glycosyltransferase [Enterobacter mori]
MKVCYFINDIHYFKLHWLDRAKAANVAGYEVHILAGLNGCKEEDINLPAEFCLHPVMLKTTSHSFFNLIAVAYRASQVINDLKPDVLHCITIKPCLSRILLRHSGKLIMSFPGLGRLFSGHRFMKRLLRKGICMGFRFAVRRNDCHLTFEHERDRAKLCSLAGISGEATRVIGVSGIDLNRFNYLPPSNNTTPVVLFAGRMLRTKGLDTLVKVCRRLRNSGVEFELHVAGLLMPDDPDAIPEHELRGWEERGDIIWHGTCHEMPGLIAKSDIIALPTRYNEGVPRILIEAAACGRPSVAYDRGGCDVVLNQGMCGELVPDGDEDAFFHALKKQICEPARRLSAGMAGRKRATNLFSAEIAAKSMLECYNE